MENLKIELTQREVNELYAALRIAKIHYKKEAKLDEHKVLREIDAKISWEEHKKTREYIYG